MKIFISCDWGTSTLRLRAVDTADMSVQAEVTGAEGIFCTFDLWKKKGLSENERISFYQSVLGEQIKRLEEQFNFSAEDIPIIVSGMASSNMGMMELTYKEVPFSAGGHDLEIRIVEASNDFKHRLLLISGVKTPDDVMRGEETQLIGCLGNNDPEDHFFIFPGTHSKHVKIKDGKVTGFKTYMTGEFFELLSAKSVLANVIEKKSLADGNNIRSFENGVTAGLESNLLHSSFLVRTNFLLNKLSKEENYWYLSGLLIGTELNDLASVELPLVIVSDELHGKLYSTALRKLGIKKFEYLDATKATINGHSKFYDLYKTELTAGKVS